MKTRPLFFARLPVPHPNFFHAKPYLFHCINNIHGWCYHFARHAFQTACYGDLKPFLDFQFARFKGEIHCGHFLNHTDVAQMGHGKGRFAHPGPCGNGAQLPCAQSAGKVVKLLEARSNGFRTLCRGKEP